MTKGRRRWGSGMLRSRDEAEMARGETETARGVAEAAEGEKLDKPPGCSLSSEYSRQRASARMECLCAACIHSACTQRALHTPYNTLLL